MQTGMNEDSSGVRNQSPGRTSYDKIYHKFFESRRNLDNQQALYSTSDGVHCRLILLALLIFFTVGLFGDISIIITT